MTEDYQIRVLPPIAYQEDALRDYIAKEKGFDARTITKVRILKRSIDARHRQIFVNLTVRVFINEEPPKDEFTPIEYGDVSDGKPIIIVGAGPGGLFAALKAIELGLRPIVVERGKAVSERQKDIAALCKNGTVEPESNYCFGEGGAGAFSDGKLYTRSKKRGAVDKILRVFCQHGASTSILADAHPHIGTDKLPRVIERMRKTIIRCGGEVHFQTRMTGFIIEGDTVKGIQAIDTASDREVTFFGPVILATGHSAHDVYNYLASSKIEIEAKGIAMGVRLEHPSQLIDRIQYHNRQGRGRYLPAAEYSFVTQVDGRGVYSFCMCPGGFVIPSASDSEQIVTNGMSPANRGGKWSNAGIVVEIHPDDAPGDEDDVLRVMHWQENLEKLTWQQVRQGQKAPAQRMVDFVNGHLSYDLPKSSYQPGLVSSPIHFWLPDFISKRLQTAFKVFGSHAHGFLTNEATVIASETRTSSPVRILRDKATLMHVRLQGLFPCGEGAGYAGGIVSAAIDGERCAELCAEYAQTI